MKTMTFIAALFAVSSAFASEYVTKKLSWGPRTHHGGTVTYYNCDSVENTVESHLEALGAQNVSVNCSGGIEMGWSTLGDLCINDGKLIGCSYYQNSVGVSVADLSVCKYCVLIKKFFATCHRYL